MFDITYSDQRDQILFEETDNIVTWQEANASASDESVPSVADILSQWIKRDFGTTENFLKLFGLAGEKFSIIAGSQTGVPLPHVRNDLFADVVGGYSKLGVNLAKLFSPYVPRDILPPRTYQTIRHGDLSIRNLAMLRFTEVRIFWNEEQRDNIDISKERLAELEQYCAANVHLIKKQDPDLCKHIELYRKKLDQQIDYIHSKSQEVGLNRPDNTPVEKKHIVQNISSTLGIHPWELYAYRPIKLYAYKSVRCYDEELNIKNINSLYSLDAIDLVSTLSDVLFVDNTEEAENERIQFYDLASHVIGKDIPADWNAAIYGEQIIPFGDLYRQKRLMLNKSILEVSKNTTHLATLSKFEKGVYLNREIKEKLDAYYGFDNDPKLKSRIDELYPESENQILSDRKERHLKNKINKFLNNVDDISTVGAMFKIFRLERLKASLQDVASVLELKNRTHMKLREDRDQITVDDLQKISDHYKISMDDPDIQNIKTGIIGPLKTDEYLSQQEIVLMTNLKPTKIKKSFDKIASEWRGYKKDPVTIPLPEVNLHQVRLPDMTIISTIAAQQFAEYQQNYLLPYTTKTNASLKKNCL